MPTIYPTHDKHNNTDNRDSFESMRPHEQLSGMLIVALVLILAIVLKSL